ncbi:hypothetical protein [Bradyrhizobium sp. LTSPM299]|nr:hypothetical protein [Bradyrhizobium sp. LTSPM299]
MTLFGADRKAEARELISLLKSSDIFELALTEVVNDRFSITDCETS